MLNEHPVASATANARAAWCEEIRKLALAQLAQERRERERDAKGIRVLRVVH